MAKQTVKTNVMRILEKEKIPFQAHEYPHDDGAIDGLSVARKLGQNPEQVFKTLVAKGASKNYLVFVLPVTDELDLKKAARAAGEKSVAMIPVSEINAVTGYIRGGCSPIGMKKQYRTFFDESCLSLEHMMVSAGKIGFQVELEPQQLITVCRGQTADLVAICD